MVVLFVLLLIRRFRRAVAMVFVLLQARTRCVRAKLVAISGREHWLLMPIEISFMKKIAENRYPNSATLFRFCKEALEIRYAGNVKVIDQDRVFSGDINAITNLVSNFEILDAVENVIGKLK